MNGMLRPALIGGFVLGILSAVPGIHLVNCLCCAWVIAGGILAANIYVSSSPVTVTLGRGVVLGAATGAVGAIVDTLFSVPIHFLVVRLGANALDELRRTMERFPDLPVEARDAAERIFSSSGAGGILMVLVSGLFKLGLYPLVAALGGAIGVALFEKRRPGGEPPLPPPPVPELPPPPPPPVG